MKHGQHIETETLPWGINGFGVDSRRLTYNTLPMKGSSARAETGIASNARFVTPFLEVELHLEVHLYSIKL